MLKDGLNGSALVDVDGEHLVNQILPLYTQAGQPDGTIGTGVDGDEKDASRGGGRGIRTVMHGRSLSNRRSSRPYNARMEHVGFLPTRQT